MIDSIKFNSDQKTLIIRDNKIALSSGIFLLSFNNCYLQRFDLGEKNIIRYILKSRKPKKNTNHEKIKILKSRITILSVPITTWLISRHILISKSELSKRVQKQKLLINIQKSFYVYAPNFLKKS